jgi:D-tyrosyl-tRNA(Tyr) deacylase
MRAVVQRVKNAGVVIRGNRVAWIDKGLMVLLGVGATDSKKDADYLAEKVVNLRIFEDDEGKMNRSLIDVNGELLIVSQFTLYGDCRKGRRPSFVSAAPPEKGNELYNYFVNKLMQFDIPVKTGVFQEEMLVEINNDGPVTILIDSEKTF